MLFSASDDRSVRAWDMMTHACVTVLRPPNKHCGTMRALCTTEEHLYIGASDGVIYVYCINGESRLSHMKHRRRMQAEIAANEAAKLAARGKRQYKAPEEKKERVFEFTLECQLDHTRACQLEDGNRVPIQCLAVGGPGGEEDYLFSASEDGSICIFSRPEDDLKFPVVQRIHDHKLAVTSMITTEFYFMSTSDDNTLRVYGMIDNTDMDKILSPPEHQPVCRMFQHTDVDIAGQMFDKYKSGTITAKDLSTLMEDLKLRLKAPEIAQLTDDDGVITKDAFIDWYVKDQANSPVAWLERKIDVGARIKSVHFNEAPNETISGHLILGLNVGRCLICPVGWSI